MLKYEIKRFYDIFPEVQIEDVIGGISVHLD